MAQDDPQYANLGEELKARQQAQYLQSQGIVNDNGAFLNTNTGNYVTDPVQAAQNQQFLSAQRQYGLMSPTGGGPTMLATPENVQQFGLPAVYSGPAAGEIAGQINAQDLIGRAIQARQNLQDQRSSLINQLGSANRRRVPAIAAQLHGIDQDQASLDREAMQQRLMAHQNATEYDKRLKMDRDTEIDSQGADLMNSMLAMDGALRRGEITKQDYDNGLLQAGQQFPMGLRHPEAGQHYQFAVEQADKHNAFIERRSFAEANKIAARYGIEPQIDPDTGLPSPAHTRMAALSTDKGKSELMKSMNDEMLQKYGVPTGVGSLFNPIQPHTSDDNYQTINLPFVDKQGKQGQMKVPMLLFNQMKSNFQDRYNIVTNAPATAPQTAQSPQQVAAGGLAAGTTRSVGGTNYSWNGTRWEPQ